MPLFDFNISVMPLISDIIWILIHQKVLITFRRKPGQDWRISLGVHQLL